MATPGSPTNIESDIETNIRSETTKNAVSLADVADIMSAILVRTNGAFAALPSDDTINSTSLAAVASGGTTLEFSLGALETHEFAVALLMETNATPDLVVEMASSGSGTLSTSDSHYRVLADGFAKRYAIDATSAALGVATATDVIVEVRGTVVNSHASNSLTITVQLANNTGSTTQTIKQGSSIRNWQVA